MDFFLGMDGSGALYYLFPNAVMCKQCFLGPIEPAFCDDMAAHHGVVMHGSQKPVNNSCPRCGWFGSDRSQRLERDGILRTKAIRPGET